MKPPAAGRVTHGRRERGIGEYETQRRRGAGSPQSAIRNLKSDPPSQGLSLIIPAYNEEQAVGEVIREGFRVGRELSRPFEIIVVNDASEDRTAFILKTLKEEFNELIVINHEKNRGYGAALKTGLREARHEMIAITDADGTYPGESIHELLAALDGADMAVGARIGRASRVSFFRRPAKWVLKKLADYLSGNTIPDLNSGLRIMRRGVVDRFMNILPDGFSFTTTITLAMLTNNYRVEFISIAYRPRRGKSKIRPFRDTMNFIQLIVRTVMYFNPLKVFIPLSLFFFFAASIVLILTALFANKIMDTTVGLLLATGVQTLLIGMVADLIDKRTRT